MSPDLNCSDYSDVRSDWLIWKTKAEDDKQC